MKMGRTKRCSLLVIIFFMSALAGMYTISMNNMIKKNIPSLGIQIDADSTHSIRNPNTKQDQEKLPHNNVDEVAHNNNTYSSPPYTIIQIGSPRSGSTFQFTLLQAICYLKTKMLPTSFFLPRNVNSIAKTDPTISVVVKTHRQNKFDMFIEMYPDVLVFTSGTIHEPNALHHQTRESVTMDPMKEIDSYQNIFNLTNLELETLKSFMTLYTTYRQCCGLQMSKYNMLRLHGCDVSSYQNQIDYPWCERHNLTDVEQELFSHTIQFEQEAPQFNGDKVGDCQKFDEKIRNGLDFNGRKFEGCPTDISPVA